MMPGLNVASPLLDPQRQAFIAKVQFSESADLTQRRRDSQRPPRVFMKSNHLCALC
jgi:hypothetical protein